MSNLQKNIAADAAQRGDSDRSDFLDDVIREVIENLQESYPSLKDPSVVASVVEQIKSSGIEVHVDDRMRALLSVEDLAIQELDKVNRSDEMKM